MNKALFVKLTDLQLVKKFPSFCGTRSLITISVMKPTWCTFYSIYWESKASTCFEHYFLILRRRFTRGIWYIACVNNVSWQPCHSHTHAVYQMPLVQHLLTMSKLCSKHVEALNSQYIEWKVHHVGFIILIHYDTRSKIIKFNSCVHKILPLVRVESRWILSASLHPTSSISV
jgi:hypothetical protein